MITVRTLIELLAVIVLIIGFCNEQRIIDWEQKQFRRIKRRIHRTLRRHYAAANRGGYILTEIDDYTVILTPADNKHHNCS